MNRLRLAAWVAMMTVAVGAGCSHGGRRGARMMELNEASAGQPVTVARGEQIRVTLRDTGSTGFRWTGGGSCGELLHKEEERAAPPKEVTPGAGGERTWLYTAAKAGSCELKFVSARSWEKAGSGKAIVYRVTIDGER